MAVEPAGRTILGALNRAVDLARSESADPRVKAESIVEVQRRVEALTVDDEAVVALTDDGFSFGGRFLPQATIELNALFVRMRLLGIEWLAFVGPPSRADLVDLVAYVAGRDPHLPAAGSVRVNDPFYRPVLPEDGASNPLRRAYSDSLEALRSVSVGEGLELERVGRIVDNLLDGGPPDAADSLLLATIRGHNESVFYHSVNVCLLSLALGKAAALDEESLRLLGTGALLHDVGRVILADPALRSPDSLTSEEWETVKLHPQEGAAAILSAAGPGQEVVAVVALEHHLRLDGGGYPELHRRDPHLFSRIE